MIKFEAIYFYIKLINSKTFEKDIEIFREHLGTNKCNYFNLLS